MAKRKNFGRKGKGGNGNWKKNRTERDWSDNKEAGFGEWVYKNECFEKYYKVCLGFGDLLEALLG